MYRPSSLAQKRIQELERRLAPQPCGHPGACIVSTDEGTGHCAWCEEVAELRARLEQADDELDAVDEALGEFYCPVLDEDDQPCGSYYEDHGVHLMRHELEKLQTLADCVPEAKEWLVALCYTIDDLLSGNVNSPEIRSKALYDISRQQIAARALAARIEEAKDGGT